MPRRQTDDRVFAGLFALVSACVGVPVDPGEPPAPALAPERPTTPPTPPVPTIAEAPEPPTAPPTPPAPTTTGASTAKALAENGPLAATALDGGVMVVWARDAVDDDKSEILAVLLDEHGREKGPPHLLRRTTGEVLDLSASGRGGQVWVAWWSQVASEPQPRGLLAAVMVAPDLSSVSPPITLRQFASESWGGGTSLVRVLGLAGGEAVVGAAGAAAVCTNTVDGERTRCPGFDMFWVRPDGTFTLAEHFGVDGGDPSIGDIVDVGTGVVFDVWAWRGGPTFASTYARYGQTSTDPPFRLVTCRPPFSRGWTGVELVTLCPDDYLGDHERCPPQRFGVERGSDACARIHAVGPDDRLVTPKRNNREYAPPMTAMNQRCHQGRPVLDVAWSGGKLRLDPQRSGASLNLDLGLWTGRYALKIGTDGRRELWTCSSGENPMKGPPFAAPLALNPPASSLRAVPVRRFQ